jgi:fucose 4-O-acetylase-like acetyltransferase
MASSSAENKPRLSWIDAARGVGILLMFYGHVVQLSFPGNHAAREQLRLIYSFHMPVFFVMAGFFFRPARELGIRVRQLAARRLLPVLFFGLAFLPLWAFSELHGHQMLGHDARELAVEYVRGRPDLDWVTWFLVCLFACETVGAVALRAIKRPAARVAFGLGYVVAGVWFSNVSLRPDAGILYTVGRTWFLSEALVALGLYALGCAAYPYLGRLVARPAIVWGALVGGLAIVLTTYRLNPRAGVVMMAARQNGDALPFLVTALGGAVFVLALGVVLAKVDWLRALGADTLPLLGLNGIFFGYVNPMLARRWHVPDAQLWVLIAALAVTVASTVACIPLLRLLNRYVPQLIGKSGVTGPWLPALEPRPVVLRPAAQAVVGEADPLVERGVEHTRSAAVR